MALASRTNPCFLLTQSFELLPNHSRTSFPLDSCLIICTTLPIFHHLIKNHIKHVPYPVGWQELTQTTCSQVIYTQVKTGKRVAGQEPVYFSYFALPWENLKGGLLLEMGGEDCLQEPVPNLEQL